MALLELEALDVARRAARVAGEVLESWAERFTVREKGRSNLVTEADLASQRAIYDVIHSHFPEHEFLGEEDTGPANDPAESRPPPRRVDSPRSVGLSPHDPRPDRSRPRWIVDPLDGTTNYVHRFPYYAVSVALEVEGEIVAGVVFDPNRDEMFAAARGHGATLNGRRIEPTTTDRLSQALVVASLPVAVGPDDPAVARFLRVLPVAQSLQRTGSAALNLAGVAAGRLDAYWSTSLKPWDMAAGLLLVREAGGLVTRCDGGPFDLYRPDLLSSNGTAIHAELQNLLR